MKEREGGERRDGGRVEGLGEMRWRGVVCKIGKGEALMVSHLVQFSMGRRGRKEAFLASFKAK